MKIKAFYIYGPLLIAMVVVIVLSFVWAPCFEQDSDVNTWLLAYKLDRPWHDRWKPVYASFDELCSRARPLAVMSRYQRGSIDYRCLPLPQMSERGMRRNLEKDRYKQTGWIFLTALEFVCRRDEGVTVYSPDSGYKEGKLTRCTYQIWYLKKEAGTHLRSGQWTAGEGYLEVIPDPFGHNLKRWSFKDRAFYWDQISEFRIRRLSEWHLAWISTKRLVSRLVVRLVGPPIIALLAVFFAISRFMPRLFFRSKTEKQEPVVLSDE